MEKNALSVWSAGERAKKERSGHADVVKVMENVLNATVPEDSGSIVISAMDQEQKTVAIVGDVAGLAYT